jgi:8-amino-7-oxononanoate synthase
MRSLAEYASEKLEALEARALRRQLQLSTRQRGAYVTRGGRRLVSFSCNDYLGLSTHPAVIEAAVTALQSHGLGAGASRLITGNHPLYSGLEARLARLKDSEAALVFGSGYLANLGIIPALAGKGDLLLADELSHACLLSGARLSQAQEMRYPHNDADAVERALAKQRASARHAFIVTDGVFSMDGDLAPLPALAALAERYDAWLLVDDAHGLGVIGGGRGSAFAFGARKLDIPLQMGTLSKAVGAYGGYVCASTPVIELLKNRARSLVYSTGLPPCVLAGAAAALDVIAENPDLVERPLSHARSFTHSLDLPEAQSAIVPLVLGSAEKALAAASLLEEAGFLVAPIRPPTVPEGTARLRFAFSAAHEPSDRAKLAEVVRTRVLPLRSSP